MTQLKQTFNDLRIGQKEFGKDISAIVNSTLLTFVYIFGVGATYIIAKLLNKEFLDTKIDKKAQTHWQDSNLTKGKMEDYYRQF
jgi:hypothetical protein